MSQPTHSLEADAPEANPLVLKLEPPEVIQPVAQAQAADIVPLSPKVCEEIDARVVRFVDAMVAQDMHSQDFRRQIDQAGAVGKEEISVAAALMQGPFMERNAKGISDTDAYVALSEVRGHLDKLDPGKQGDLLSGNKLLGFIPWGTKLQAYFRMYERMGDQLRKSMNQVQAAREDMDKDVVAIESTRSMLWNGMLKLAEARRFAKQLDTVVAQRVTALKTSDPQKAQALEQEVLFYVRQNLSDILTQLAVCVNGYLALGVLKKTGREMANGCTRVLTIGMSALAVAQTVALATGSQVRVMEMLQGVSGSIGNLVESGGKLLGVHVQKTAEFSSNPLLGVQQMKAMWGHTFQAMDTMDSYRSKAIEAMGKNNEMIAEQLQRAEAYVDRNRLQLAREAI